MTSSKMEVTMVASPTQELSARFNESAWGAIPNAAPLVLLAQDELASRTHLRAALNDERLRIVEADTGSRALSLAAVHNPDVVVLDSTIADLNGIQVTRKLREWTPAPILILAARNDEHEKIAALDAGANEYLPIPLAMGEFMARMRVWLRQTQRGTNHLSATLEVGQLRVDFGKLQAWIGDREVRLTPVQYKLFSMMMRNAGKILSHEEILTKVWGPACKREIQYVRIYMRQLREKFEDDPARPRYFIKQPGVGYGLLAE